mgnify:CR=1 FL=1
MTSFASRSRTRSPPAGSRPGAALPAPSKVVQDTWELITQPFYDRGGNENTHLYVREADGTERDLTPGEKTKANFLGWSHDRKSFYYSTNERDPKFFDVFEMTVADMKPTMVFKNEPGLDFADISNDKRFVALNKSGASTVDSDIYLYDTRSKELKKITPNAISVVNRIATHGVCRFGCTAR